MTSLLKGIGKIKVANSLLQQFLSLKADRSLFHKSKYFFAIQLIFPLNYFFITDIFDAKINGIWL